MKDARPDSCPFLLRQLETMAPATYNNNKLAGKHVLILGATSGIGFGVAKACMASAASLTISSSSAERIHSTVQKLRADFPDGQIKGYACNLAGEDVEQEIERLFQHVDGPVDHIVYTAADALTIAPIQEITRERIIAAGQVRFVAPILVAKVGSRYLSAGPESSIVFTSGTVWEHPMPNWSLVSGYMGGVCSVARNLALDLKPIRVNVVSPGLVDTEMWDPLIPDREQKAGLFRLHVQKHATGRVARPEDVAEAYLYVMKDANIMGRVVSTDSGALLF